jgi:transposase InsO family protein
MKFVLACEEEEECFAQLCRVYGVSRRVGYKWLRRYEDQGVEGLKDQSRAPHAHPDEVSEQMQQSIVKLRSRHPRWGPRKLKVLLEREGSIDVQAVPAASTIGAILKREGLSIPRKRLRHAPASAPLGECHACNRIWCADFKGWFKTSDGARCDPLTISDGFSRYLLRCQAVSQSGGEPVRRVFEACFREHGLPEAMRTDNGSPFASVGVAGLSRLSVWWVRLGIGLERIEPGKPQQNGRHERMHLTLKQETAMPPQRNLRQQQERFNAFREEFNELRPHEALEMNTPASFYEPSKKAYPERLEELEYPCGYQLRKVGDRGQFRFHRHKVMIGKALRDQTIGLEAMDDRYWRAWFGPVELGIFDEKQSQMLRPGQLHRHGF